MRSRFVRRLAVHASSLAALVVALGLAACGGSGSGRLPATVGLLGGSCFSAHRTATGAASCVFTFSDGERFGCSAFPPRATDAHAGALAVVHDAKCRREATAPVPPKLGAMTRETNTVVACLNRHHLDASGFTSFVEDLPGPLAGEIDSTPTYITIYLSPGVAARSVPRPANGTVRVGRFLLLATEAGKKTPPTVTGCLRAA